MSSKKIFIPGEVKVTISEIEVVAIVISECASREDCESFGIPEELVSRFHRLTLDLQEVALEIRKLARGQKKS